MSLAEAHALAASVLVAAGTSPENARPVADALVRAETDGVSSHGLSRLPVFSTHVKIGKVDGKAEPKLRLAASAAVVVDAACGFPHRAIALGLGKLDEVVRSAGVAGLAVTNSYNCGIVGHRIEGLARKGLVALAFVNSPKSMAPWGGVAPVFGTNPLAFACPRASGDPIVVDLASTKVNRSAVVVAAEKGAPIPEGWALDSEGRPTTDAKAALKGSMLPTGEHKGACIAMMVDIMAAALVGANLSHQASSYIANDGGPPRTGHFFVAMDPMAFGGALYFERIEALVQAILRQAGTRLPGATRFAHRRRSEAEGLAVEATLCETLRTLARG